VNANKILVITGIAVAAVSANAQVNLTAAGSFSLGGVYAPQNPLMPTYTPGSSTTSITLGPSTPGSGSLNQWWFSAIDTGGTLTTVTYDITVTGITPLTYVSGLVTGWAYNMTTGVVGPQNYITSFYNGFAGPGPSTRTFAFTEDITSANTSTAFFKGNFQLTDVVPEPTGIAALAIGALGLLIRRRGQ